MGMAVAMEAVWEMTEAAKGHRLAGRDRFSIEPERYFADKAGAAIGL